MSSQTNPTPITSPIPRRRSPLLTHHAFAGQDLNLCLTSSLSTKAKSPYTFIMRDIDIDNDYAPPAPPPPSPVNYPRENWSTAYAMRR
ncbi:hypothetical protein QTJ16_005383 [Diplocarpon rosae]|uniref:Uncharacterized protein n=1 Tax=Diplocarpon rosae TaxID=946125 RepID=A0AAD9SY17_9HELO|nr:hypothetical protein QTJ16_005383 [Diplocarpon rosae]